MIKVNNVTKTFDGFRALDGLTMTVEQGSIYGLVGPNGAGKSTILRHIMGVYRPDSGSILVDGQPVFENPAVKAKIAVIPDDLYYFPSASTRDMARFYRGMYPAFDGKRYEALREAFPDVDDKQPIRRLSKGMQKQSAFWLALCCQPQVLVLDEPTAGLDPVGVESILGNIRDYHQAHNATVILVSHSMEEVARTVDRLVVVNDGKIPFQGTPRQVFQHGDELEAMGLGVPQLTRVFHRLRAMGADVDPSVYTLEQAKAALLNRLGRAGKGAV